jgi:DNA polymerase-3 subunit delta
VKTNLTLIAGDAFLRSQKAKAIVADFVKKTAGAVENQSFRLEETPLENILSNARTLPFLAQGQTFFIQGSERLKTADLELLDRYLSNANEGTLLIFESDSLEGKEELQKFMRAKGQVVVLAKEESRSAAQSFLQQKLARFQKTMPQPARMRLLEMCGEAAVFLDSMIDRLIQYAGDKPEITEDMVAEFEEKWTEVSVFQLTNALLARDREKAVRTFRELMEDYEADIVSMVGILHWQLRSLWQGAALLEEGVRESEMLSRVKVPAFRQRSFMTAVRGLGVEKLERAIEALYQLDKKSKVGQAEGVPGLESWLLQYV